MSAVGTEAQNFQVEVYHQLKETAQGLGLLEADVCIAVTEIDSEVGVYNLAVLVAEGSDANALGTVYHFAQKCINLSNMKFIPPKAVIFSFFFVIFAMSVGVL